MKKYVSENSFLNINNSHKQYPQYSVTISDNYQNFCVGVVDIIGSSITATKLKQNQIGSYYEIFLNSMSKVLSRFGGVIIKNIGDCLLFFFPESGYQNRKYGFVSCLECILAMTEEQDAIKEKLDSEKLPPLNYRISVDYGNVFVMKSNENSIDLIGTPVNICAKINHYAPVNGIAMGGDLFQLTKKFNEYEFIKLGGFPIITKKTYPIYSIKRNEK